MKKLILIQALLGGALPRNALKALLLSLFLGWGSASAQLEVNVSGAKIAGKNIAVVPFGGDHSQVDFVVAGDLKKSGTFNPIDPRQLPAQPHNPGEINFGAFNGIDYLVVGSMNGGSSANVSVAEVSSQRVLASENLSAASGPALGHEIADFVLNVITGKRGVFSTKVAYVLEQGNGGNRKYNLVVSDVDGNDRRIIFSSTTPIVSPAWSPNAQAIAFATYANQRAQIVIANLGGGHRVVAQSDATSSSPAFSRDGRALAYVQSANGKSNIFLVDLGSGAQQQLTNGSAIDTEPVFSPDGQSIYFTSDRSGSPQIYRMSRSGGNAQPVVKGFTSSGDLSADGEAIAVTKQGGGRSQIGLYHLNSGRFEALSNGHLDEGASFAPNGQMLIYATRENGRSVLKIINHKGGLVKTLADSNGRLRDPAWAPDNR